MMGARHRIFDSGTRFRVRLASDEALAAELEAAGLLWMRVHSVWLTQEGRQLIASGLATGAPKAKKQKR